MRKPKKPPTKVVEMESGAPNEPDSRPEPEKTEPPKKTKPAETPPKPVVQKTPTFWQNVASFPQEDWGKRVFLYIYCLEPLCNLKQSGEVKYLNRLESPIQDEQQIMADYGSGKYRLVLNKRKQGSNLGEMVDQTEIELYNPKYPPKIPRAVWINDQRNERWAALLPKEEPHQTPSVITDTLKTFREIRNDLREELPAPAAPTADIDRFTSMVTAVKTLLPTPAPPTDNAMVQNVFGLLTAMMQSQAESSRQQMQAALEEARTLRAEIKDMRTNNGQSKQSPLKEIFGEIKELVPQLKELGIFEGGSHGRTNWLDIIRDAAPSFLDTVGKVAMAFAAHQPGSTAQPNPGMPALPPSPAIPGSQPPGAQANPGQQMPNAGIEQRITQFLGQNSTVFLNYFRGFVQGENDGGQDFGQWVFDGFGDGPINDARIIGFDKIMGMFRASPVWEMLKVHEVKLIEFVNGFLGWKDDAPEESSGPEEEVQGVDLTGGGV